MKRLFTAVLVVLFALSCQNVYAQKGEKRGPSEKAYEKANENAKFKRGDDWQKGNKKMNKEGKEAEKEAKAAEKKAEKEAKQAEKKAKKEAKQAQKKAEKEAKKASAQAGKGKKK